MERIKMKKWKKKDSVAPYQIAVLSRNSFLGVDLIIAIIQSAP